MDVEKEKGKLVATHEKALHAMLRRIERDRREQVKHRQFDTQRLIQRNKNLLKDIYNRQAHEKRKTKTFLNWALSDINIFENRLSTDNQAGRSGIKKLQERQISKDIKIVNKLMGPKTHKIKQRKQLDILMNKRESVPNYKYGRQGINTESGLMVLRNSKNARNRSYAAINGRLRNEDRGSLMNITKHRAGSKIPKKPSHNRSFNAPYKNISKIDDMDYASVYA